MILLLTSIESNEVSTFDTLLSPLWNYVNDCIHLNPPALLIVHQFNPPAVLIHPLDHAPHAAQFFCLFCSPWMMDSPFPGFQQHNFVWLHAVPFDVFFPGQYFEYFHDSAAVPAGLDAQFIHCWHASAPGGVVADDPQHLSLDVRQHVAPPPVGQRGYCQ